MLLFSLASFLDTTLTSNSALVSCLRALEAARVGVASVSCDVM